MRNRRVRAALLVLLITATSVVAVPQSLSAAPGLDVSITGPGEVLVGNDASFTLSALNSTVTPGYNTGFRVVLPAGVSLGTSAVPAQVFDDAPLAGQTTLVFENVNDSQPASSVNLDFTLSASTVTWPVGTAFAITAEAYTSDDPRVVPSPDSAGVMGSYTGSGTDTVTTDVVAITIVKSEPSPEHELLRGVHAHTTVYTLTVENNPTNATNGVVVDDYLPAGLEFLACGTIDNTTDAPTFPGNAVEYLGAPSLTATPLVGTDCPSAGLVETVSVDPDGTGPMPLDIYTHVQWNIGNQAVGQTTIINYAAGVPIRENTLTWSGGSAPASTGAQAANLDNNDGDETTDEQQLENYAEVAGSYTGTLGGGATNPVGDTDRLIVTAEDIRLLKSVSTSTVTQTSATVWTLTINTSEYRTVTNLDVVDTLPDGHCPLGPINYENVSDQNVECNSSGTNPSIAYSSVTEQTDGSYEIRWDDVANLSASDELVITFPSKVRVSYQENYVDTTPVVTADGFVNSVALTGDDYAAPNVPADETDGTPDVDASSASQSAFPPTMGKTISTPAAPGVALDCSTATYIDADDLATAPFAYRPGDRVCYTLRVDIPANLTLRNALVSDFLPDGVTFLSNEGPTGSNDIGLADFNGPLDFTDGTAVAAGDDSLAWELGTTMLSGARYLPISAVDRVFEVRFTAEFTGAPTGSGSSLEKANLMKLTSQNTVGQAISLRDQATFIAVEPELTIAKNTPSTQVVGGDTVDYTVTIANIADAGPGSGSEGYAAAENVTVTDDLPSPVTCSDVTTGPSGGATAVCVGSQITWTIANLDAGASTDLIYTVTMPTGIGPDLTMVNTATLVSFDQLNNDLGTTTYTPAATAQETITTPAVSLEKQQFSALAETGNRSNITLATTLEEATIGETMSFSISVDIPDGVTVYDADFRDVLPTGMTVVGGSIQGTLDTGSGPTLLPTAGFAFDGTDPLRINFPTTWTNAAASGVDTVTISFDATIDDILANSAGSRLRNRGRLHYKPSSSGSFTNRYSSYRDTDLVEPDPQIAKDENDADDIIDPGQTIDYTLSITNPDSGMTSVAHDLVVVDTIPDRLNPVLPIPDGGVWNAGLRTITWDGASTPGKLTSVAPDAPTVTLSYQVTTDNPILVGGPITNTATVSATSMATAVTGERTTYGDSASDTVSTPSVTITKALDPDDGPYTIGETVAYQLDLTVPQDAVAYDVTATDTIPDGLVFDGTTSVTANGNCVVTGSTGLDFSSVGGDGTTSVAWFLGDTTAVGGDCVFTIDYTTHVDSTYNGTGSPGDGAAVSATDTLSNSARGNWMLTDTVGTPTGSGDLPGAWDDQTTIATETITIVEPQLVLDKDVTTVAGCDNTHAATGPADDDTCTIESGHPTLTYTITVRNSGSEPAHDLVVTDQPDVELANIVPVTGVADLTDGWTAIDPDMRWDIVGPLAPGASLTLSYTADLVSSASLDATSIVINTADVPSYFGLDAATRAIVPNERTYGSIHGPVTADTVSLDLEFPDLVTAKTVASGAESGEATIGQAFEWRVTVTNTATVASASGVDLTDTLPVNWDYVDGSAELCTPACVAIADPSESGAEATGLQLDWTDLAGLTPGGSLEVRFDSVPLAAAATTPGSGGTIDHTNTASAAGDDASGASGNADGIYVSADDTANGVIYEADVRIDKQIVTAGPYLQGQTVDYRIVVDNDGPDAATGVVVNDVLDAADLIYLSTVSVDGSYDSGSGAWTLPASVANGGSAGLVVRVLLGESGTLTNRAQVTAADRFDPDSQPANASTTPQDDDDAVSITVGTASLGSTVWYDIDGSGGDETTKGLEPGIPGVTADLLSAGNDDIFGNADDFWGPDGVAGGGDDILVTSVVTDANGNYSFVNLPDGTYRVVIDSASLPGGDSGWSQTHDDGGGLDHTSGNIVLDAATTGYLDADFSYTGAGTLGDEVFWDVDRSADGTFAGPDLPIPLVDVDLTWNGFDNVLGNADDVTFPTMETNVSGGYLFGNLPPGGYRVVVITADLDFPVGLVDQTWDVVHTAPGGGDGDPSASVDLNLGAGQDRTDVDFSFTGTAQLGDKLWLDLDGDGVVGSGEPGIPAVTVVATWYGPDGVSGGGDDQLFTTVTDASGDYTFDNLAAGIFTVAIDTADPDFPAGLVPSYDLDGTASADQTVVTLAAGQQRSDADFGYTGTGSIGDTVWLDLDGDGAIGGVEVGIPGVQVDIIWSGVDGVFGTSDDVSVSQVTDGLGIYGQGGLPLGDYWTSVDISTLPAGLSATFDVDGGLDDRSDVTLTGASAARDDVDFGYRGSAAVGDTVWADLDADGEFDGDETGIDGVALEITLAGGDGVLGTDDDMLLDGLTAGGGTYNMGWLPSGPIQVAVVGGVPSDHAQVSDPDTLVDRMWAGVLASAETNLDIDFGFRIDANLSITKSHVDDFIVGQTADFDIVVNNEGPADAVDVVVTDDLPAGLTFVSATGMTCSAVDQLVTCTSPLLADGDSVTVVLTVEVTVEAAPSVLNAASVTSSIDDIDPSDNSDDDLVGVPLAELALSKTLATPLIAGQEGTYRLTVSNTGPSAAEEVVVTDVLPVGLSFVSVQGSGWSCSNVTSTVVCQADGPLATGESSSFDLVVDVAITASGSIANSATVESITMQSVLADDTAVASALVSAQTLAFTGSTLARLLALSLVFFLLGLGVLRMRRIQMRPTED